MSTAAGLQQVLANESGGNYAAQNPNSTASGGYGFINSTWNLLATKAGFPQYAAAPAKYAPASVQDQVAAYAYNNYDPNSTFLWAASAPPGGYPPAGPTTAAASQSLNPSFSIVPSPTTGYTPQGTPVTTAADQAYPASGANVTNAAPASGSVNLVGAIGGGFSSFIGAIESWIGRGFVGLLALILVAAGLFMLSMNTKTGQAVAKWSMG